MTTGYGNILTSKRHGVSFTFVKVTPSRVSKHDLFLADFISISGVVTNIFKKTVFFGRQGFSFKPTLRDCDGWIRKQNAIKTFNQHSK